MDALAKASPKLYYLLAWLMAAIGYAYLMLFPVLTIFPLVFVGYTLSRLPLDQWGPTDGLIAACAVIVSILASLTSIAIFKTRPELPPGRPLLSGDFPVLLNRIAEIRTSYNAPDIDQVKLTTRFDMEIIQSPLHGFPSGFSNTLMIGLPLMSCMSPLHLKLLLAREIGHLSLARSQYQRRLLYLRHVWQQYANEYSHEWRFDTFILRIFFSWYARFYAISTDTLVELESFVKDRCMLDITTAQRAAEAIASYNIKRRFVSHEFWPVLNNMAYTEPKPPWLPYSTMDKIIQNRLDKQKAQDYYNGIAGDDYSSGEIDLLHRRMKALNQDDFYFPAPKPDNAAHHFFGDSLKAIQSQMDNIWFLKNKSIWMKRYKEGINERKHLKQLRAQAAQALLSNDEARNYIKLLNKYVEPEKALPLCYELLHTNSLDPVVCYEVGRMLTNAHDNRGIEALELAMHQDRSMTIDCCKQIIKHLVHIGDINSATRYRRKILTYQVEA